MISNDIKFTIYRKLLTTTLEFHKFLVNITKCNNGVLTIERKKLIDIAAAYMECTPLEAHNILMKMKTYGWIKTLDKDYIIVNLEKKI
jgi:glutamate formiminotransferase